METGVHKVALGGAKRRRRVGAAERGSTAAAMTAPIGETESNGSTEGFNRSHTTPSYKLPRRSDGSTQPPCWTPGVARPGAVVTLILEEQFMDSPG